MIFSLSTKAGHLMDFFFYKFICAIVLQKKRKTVLLFKKM